MTRGEIKPGVCGFDTVVTASSQDLRHVRLAVDSQCPALLHLVALLPEQIDAYAELEPDNPRGVILRLATENLYCAGCPVPSAMIKAAEVEAGLAEPVDVTIRLEQDTGA